MKFKILEMLINNHFVTCDDCHDAFNNDTRFVEQTGTMIYLYRVEFVRDRWMFVSCDYDTKQYRPTVYDIEQGTETGNPRSRSQNELRQQFFALYDCEEDKLYISDFGKKGALRTFFNHHFVSPIKLRECYQDPNQFAETLHFLKSIRLVQDRALHHAGGQDLFRQRIGNDLGLDAPRRVVTKISMPPAPLNNIQEMLRNLGQQKDAHLYDEVVIIGEDAFGAEKKFDYESFVGEITIDVEKDPDNRYIVDDVKTTLILCLGGDENVQEA